MASKILTNDTGNIQPDLDNAGRQMIDQERGLFVQLMGILAAKNNIHELMQKITLLLTNWSGCRSVGIRLRDGDDYPYYESRGFSKEFVLAESGLCDRDQEGKLIRTHNGQRVLACICGRVIDGRTDPSLPFFTKSGSFWTNSTSELLAHAGETDLLGPIRNRCYREGYESLALVPLRADGFTFGLLQFNDQRRDRFTQDLISLLERLADGVALGLAYRKARAALAKSENTARSLLNAPDDSMMLVDSAGRILDINRVAAYTLARARPGALRGRILYDFLPPNPARSCKKHLRQVVRTGKPVQFRDVRQSRHFDHHLYPVPNHEDRVDRVAIFAKDVTAELETQLKLQREELRYRELYRNTPAMLHSIDTNGKLVEVSDYWLRKMGYSREEVIGCKSTDFLNAASRKKAESELLPAFYKTGSAQDVEYQFIKKNGEIIDVLLSAISEKDPDGNVIRSLAVLDDITERKKLKENTRLADERIQLAVWGAELGLWDENLITGAAKYDRGWSEMLGYSLDEVESSVKFYEDRIHPEDKPIVLKKWQDYIHGKGSIFEAEHRLKTKSGLWKWILTRGKIVEWDREQRPVRATGTHLDITESKMAMEALQQKETELRRKAESLEELNVVLNVLLDFREKEKRSIEQNVMLNVRKLVLPFLKRMENIENPDQANTLIEILKRHLSELTQSFSNSLALQNAKLTSTEMQIAELVRQGKSNKEIAAVMDVSTKAVEFHRYNIRRKLGLAHKKINLHTYLKSIS